MNASFWIGLCPGLRREQLDYAVEVIAQFCRSH